MRSRRSAWAAISEAPAEGAQLDASRCGASIGGSAVEFGPGFVPFVQVSTRMHDLEDEAEDAEDVGPGRVSGSASTARLLLRMLALINTAPLAAAAAEAAAGPRWQLRRELTAALAKERRRTAERSRTRAREDAFVASMLGDGVADADATAAAVTPPVETVPVPVAVPAELRVAWPAAVAVADARTATSPLRRKRGLSLDAETLAAEPVAKLFHGPPPALDDVTQH